MDNLRVEAVLNGIRYVFGYDSAQGYFVFTPEYDYSEDDFMCFVERYPLGDKEKVVSRGRITSILYNLGVDNAILDEIGLGIPF